MNFLIFFADDASLLLVGKSVNESASTLNKSFLKIQHWAYLWKMSFNPDRTKQAQEVIFLRKTNISRKSSLQFNNAAAVEQTLVQKDLDINLDSKLSFTEHINDKII